MKRYLLLTLVVMLVLVSGLLSGCAQEGIIPSTVDTSPQPDAGLIEFQQMKVTQLEQLDTELADLQVKIDEKRSEVEHLNNLIDEAYERISKQLRDQYPEHPGVQRGEPVGTRQLTTEEIVAMYTIDGVISQLSHLREQEWCLLVTKQYLEQDIEEIQQHAKLEKYYELKLSQLDDLTTQLVVLRIDIDQKIAGAQQEYNRLLIQRQYLQQDIEQLEQLQWFKGEER